jgi:hypothetical protein
LQRAITLWFACSFAAYFSGGCSFHAETRGQLRKSSANDVW